VNGTTQSVASYDYCPTGNSASPDLGIYAFVNAFRKWGVFYDWKYKILYVNGQQIDASSLNARQLGGGGTTTVGAPTLSDFLSALLTAIVGGLALSTDVPQVYPTVYRVYGGPDSPQLSRFWTTLDPRTALHPPGYRSLAG